MFEDPTSESNAIYMCQPSNFSTFMLRIIKIRQTILICSFAKLINEDQASNSHLSQAKRDLLQIAHESTLYLNANQFHFKPRGEIPFNIPWTHFPGY